MRLYGTSLAALLLLIVTNSHAQSQYNGIPLIPGSQAGKEIINKAYYQYRSMKTLREVETFYTRYYENKGFSKSISARSKKHVLTGGPSLDINFIGAQKKVVNMVLMYNPKEHATLIWLKNKNFDARTLRNPKVPDDNAETLLKTILE